MKKPKVKAPWRTRHGGYCCLVFMPISLNAFAYYGETSNDALRMALDSLGKMNYGRH